MKKEKIVLLIGSIVNDGIIGQIRVIHKRYIQRSLHSNPANWEKINSLFDELDISTVICKLTTHTYERLADNNYSDIRKSLFENISKVPHIIFVFEGLLTGSEEISSPESDEGPYSTNLPDNFILNNVNQFLSTYKLNIHPYIRTSDITILAQNLIEQVEEGLVFRIYLPHKHYLSNEIDKIITLFGDYLGKSLGKKVRLDQVRTNIGIIYSFLSQGEIFETSISENFNEFTEILNMCLNDPQKAEEILSKKINDKNIVLNVINRYEKESRRILVDIKHSSESKILALKQRLESELIDIVNDYADIENIIQSIIPNIINPSPKQIPKFLLKSPDDTNVTININPKYIDKVEGIIIEEFSGSLSYNENDKLLLELFQKYEENSFNELKSALNELKDSAVPIKYKMEAKQKLKKFVIKFGSKIGAVGFNLLQKYIENQLFGKTG